MTAQLIHGNALAKTLRATVKAGVLDRHNRHLPPPGLAVILVGDDPASTVYVSHKRTACAEVGVAAFDFDLPATATESELLTLIAELNHRPDVHGILVQLPLPAHINTSRVLDAIDPRKDVDGFHPLNLGLLAQRRPTLRPCTPKGVITLLKSVTPTLSGLHAVVIGVSNIVGRPMGLELLLEGCTVTFCHSQTRDLPSHTRQADILISAVGKPRFLHGDWVKPGAIVIDVGINRLDNGSLVGDVDVDTVRPVAGFLTPVPGGVGPMTIATLLDNTLRAANALDNR